MIPAGPDIFQDVGGASSKGGHTWMPIDIFIIVQAGCVLLTRCVSSGPMVRVEGGLESGRSIPTVRVSELVVCEHNSVDQMDEFVWVGAVKAGFVGGLGDVCSLACNDGLC